ncbi:MAG: tripartite tricarboxylate transporter substrate binding protein [Acetobacteraceae bacterium]|nr:tripartite tricarboxylate transporter substrate binding protein [Acetobacteraceae bacterium]MDW8398763.1 tripartite tricarboxylate transporter substrate binding protein [Acetobacteraceae bacterium]
MPPRISRRAALAAAATIGLPAQGRAQAPWPTRQVTIQAPFTPGGPVDILARMLASHIQATTSQPAVVENRAGAAGNIGIEIVRRGPPDGSSLLVIPAGNFTINPTLLRGLSWDVERDFAPILMLAATPNLILANRESGIRDLATLAAEARRRGDLPYGTPGVGSQLHLTMEVLKRRLDLPLTHVPYRGTTQAVPDLLSGQIPLMVSNLPVALPLLANGQVNAVAVTTAARSPLAPEIPTLAEQGLPELDVASWYGLFAPRATPAAIQEAIRRLAAEALRTPQNAEVLRAQGMTVSDEAGEVFAARIRRETAQWGEIIRALNIRAE